VKRLLKRVLVSASLANVAVVAATANAERHDEQAPLGPRPGSVTRFDLEKLLASMARIVDGVRGARSPDELTWVLSEQICGDDFASFQQAQVFGDLLAQLAEHEGFEVTEGLVELRDLFLLSLTLGLGFIEGNAEQASVAGGGHDSAADGAPLSMPSIRDLLYGNELPRPVQAALYGAFVGQLGLLVLDDDDGGPMPEWLRDDLHTRARQGLLDYVAFLVGSAVQSGRKLPESPLLARITSMDLVAVQAEHERQEAAVAKYIAKRRAAKGA